MAQLVGGAVGAVVGWFVGGPTGAQYGWMIGATLGAATQKGPRTQGPRLEDLRVNGTEYGQAIPWVAGSPVISGQIVWASKRREIATRTSQGKGSGPKHTEYTYEVDLLVILTENETGGVSRIWANGDLVFGNGTAKNGQWTDMRVYRGTQDQLPDPTYEAAVGVGNAPAYRGRTYVVFEGLQLGNTGYLPNLMFEIGQVSLGDSDSDFFFADYENGTWDDVACESSVTNIDSRPGTIYSVGPSGPLSVRNDGWLFDELFSRGVFYEFGVNYVGAAGADGIAIDLVFSASTTPGATSVTRADIFYLAQTPGGAANIPTSHCWLYVGFEGASGLVNSVSLGVRGVTVMTQSRTPTGGDIRVTIYCQRNGVTRFYVDESYIGERVGPSSIVLYDTMLLGGGTDTNSKIGAKWATIEYHTVRVLADPVDEVTPISVPVCGAPVYGVATPQPLTNVTAALLQRAGYVDKDFSIVELASIEKPIRGFAVSQVSTTRAAIEAYQPAFFFDWSKSDRIYARPRPIISVATIPFRDLGASEDRDDSAEPFALQMANELERPAQISLSFPNVLADYQVSTEHSERIASQDTNQSIQMPLGMTPAEGKGVADGLLFDMIAGLMTTTIRVGLKYAFLEPGDVILVTSSDGRQYRMNIKVRRDLMIRLEFECVIDDVGAIVSSQVTDEGYVSHEDPVLIAPTVWKSLDIPILRDADDEPGYYVAVAPDRTNANDEWAGAIVARAWDGVSYERLLDTTTASVMGVCLTTLQDWTGGNYFDEASTLRVTVEGELAGSTRDAMYADIEINALLVGREIVRFRVATLVGAVGTKRTYDLSSFLRGQRGTEWAQLDHEADEVCVLLDAQMRRVTTQNSQINLLRYMKAATFGLALSSVTAEEFTDTGVALKPFSVANPNALADGPDLVLTWQRRSRLSYRYGGLGGVSVPLGEMVEAYRVKVYDNPALAPVATYLSNDPQWIYTAAQMSSDGFSASDVITFEVSQLSELVGEGYPSTCEGIAP